jgi:hypothetical protein
MNPRRTARNADRRREEPEPDQHRRHHRHHGKRVEQSHTTAVLGEPRGGYVQTWLDQTAARAPDRRLGHAPDNDHLPSRRDPRRTGLTDERAWRPRHLLVDGHLDDLDLLNGKPAYGGMQRHRSGSPDSFFIERRHRPSPEPPDHDRTRKRKRLSSPPDHEPTAERFGKRPRHKTREERYEPGGGRKPPKNEQGQDASISKKRRSGKKKTAKLTSAKEVMNNFTSKAILNDRLTVRRNTSKPQA